jgi:hypothetical protein
MNLAFAITEAIVLFITRIVFTAIGRILGFLIGKIISLFRSPATKTNKKRNLTPEQREAALIEERHQREARHVLFTNTLNDEFASLDMPLTDLVHNASRAAKNAVINKHGGSATSLAASASDMLENSGTDWKRGAIQGALNVGAQVSISRPVADLSEKEIQVLKVLSLMNSLMLVADDHFASVAATIVYNGGKCLFETNFMDKPYVHDAIEDLVKSQIPLAVIGLQRGVDTIGKARLVAAQNNPESLRLIDEELKGGSGWLDMNTLPSVSN